MTLKYKKLIQVPMGKELVNELTQISKEKGESRAEIIRKACRDYLDRMKEKKLEEIYKKGYEKLPEDPLIPEISAELFAQMAEEEEW